MSYIVALFVRFTGLIGYWLYFMPKYFYEDKNNNPRKIKSKVILISNHTSLLNFISLEGFYFWRIPHVLAAEVLYKKKFMTWFLTKMGCIKVNRATGDLTFMNDTVKVLNKDGVIGIFPEGRIPNKKEGIVEFKPSVIYIALKTNAPIVPLYMTGNYGFFKKNYTMVGKPINIRDYCHSEYPTQQEIKELSQMLHQKVEELRDQLNAIINKEKK